MGAIEYDFMTTFLNNKKKKNDNEGSTLTNLFAGVPNSMFGGATTNTFAKGGGIHIKHPGRLTALKKRTGKTEAELWAEGNPEVRNFNFAFGGDLQTNGADFGTGLTHINAGGSHEESPYDGVQMGVDPQGVPNLVEEGEVVFNDYVYSNRIHLDEEAKEKFHFPKKKDITYAEAAKKLEKEIAEHPNDPISEAGFKAQMQELADQQERQKQEMEAARAREAFEALSPDEQVAVMDNAAQQEAMAQQAAQEQAMAQQQAMQQPSPEEAAMMQQQMAQAQAAQEQQDMAAMQANVSALGGELLKAGDVDPKANIFAAGSRIAKRTAKNYDETWFRRQARALGIDDKYMEDFTYDPNDPTSNLAVFNAIYARQQKDRALGTYRKGQRQSKRNELFGDRGLYRMSDDGENIYKARIAKKGEDWVNKDNKFISDEEYQKLLAEDKDAAAGYQRTRSRVGDRLYGYNNQLMEDIQEGLTEDALLDAYDKNYDEGFKWNDRDAQTLQYPVSMEHSNLSKLRYLPALGGLFGLGYDLLNPADYSRAEAIKNIGDRGVAPMITPHYIGDYKTYRPLDIWYAQNRMDASARAADRTIMNSSLPTATKYAALLANNYNNTLSSGNLFRQAREYNDNLDTQALTINRGTNIHNADMDYKTQLANQKAQLDAAQDNNKYKYLGLSMMDDIDNRRGQRMSANLTNVLQSFGNIGDEAYDEDRLKWLEDTGVLRSDYFNRGKYGAKYGGKLRKKGGKC